MITRVFRIAIFSFASCFVAATALAANPIVISQIYGGGGNAGATLRNDFVELFNRGSAQQDLSGWCVQYASATGSFTLGNNQRVPLTGVIAPGGYYLIQMSQGTGGTQDLPAPDDSGLTAMSATSGKLVLLSNCVTAFGDAEPLNSTRVVDFVGFGTAASRFEGTSATGNLSNTTAGLRANNGCQDTDDNRSDFLTGDPTPRNSHSPANSCVPASAPIVPQCPTSVVVPIGNGTPQTFPVSASDADGRVAAAEADITPPQILLTNFAPAGAIGGTATATLNVTGPFNPPGFSFGITFTNDDPVPQTARCTINLVVTNPSGVRIHDIQGASHISPLNGQPVSSVPGIVTAKTSNGFYLQDPNPDNDIATSEGIFVFTSSAPTVSVGDSVFVSGTVNEFRPGGADGATNLTTTQITSPQIVVQSSGNPLPPPVIIGAGGRIPPTDVIDDDATGDVETSGVFDPVHDGIDFYESMEGMRVQLNNVVAVGPTNSFGELAVIGDNGANAGLRTPRGGIVIRPNDNNPERVFIEDSLAPVPAVNVGDTAPLVVGVLGYNFGNFMISVTSSPVFSDNGLTQQVASMSTPDQLSIASFNVENLSPADPPAKFARLANEIVKNLRAPDLIGVMEIQDNSGPTNNGVVDATQTFQTLIAAIFAAGGPNYDFRSINPVDGQDGGQPGGNIRVGFLFNSQRVSFIDRPGGTPTSSTTIVAGPYGPQLSASPGRLDPTNSAFNASRKPLAGEFLFNGKKLFVIANHFNSKGGDHPLFGHFQPPVQSSEVQRQQQANVVAGFLSTLFASDNQANVVVLGDLNDYQFSPPLTILKSAGLVDLVETLPENERYTYVFEGNSQVLDHILIGPQLASSALPTYEVVHVNSEFADQASDHEPEVARLSLPLIDLAAQLGVQRSGLVFNRANQSFVGTIQLTNSGSQSIAGPIELVFDGLPAGVTVSNATGIRNGLPYITLPQANLASGATVTTTIQFADPSRTAVSYTLHIYSGQFQ